jgi:Methyltransferase domain
VDAKPHTCLLIQPAVGSRQNIPCLPRVIRVTGKWTCDLDYIVAGECTVFSLGSNGDATFEAALLDRAPHCKVSCVCCRSFETAVADQLYGMRCATTGKLHQLGLHCHYRMSFRSSACRSTPLITRCRQA